MRKLIAWSSSDSLDGLLADEGTQYWQFCFGLPNEPDGDEQKLDVYQGAYAHLMGRTAYEALAGAPTIGNPCSAARAPSTRSHPDCMTVIAPIAPSTAAASGPRLSAQWRTGSPNGRTIET